MKTIEIFSEELNIIEYIYDYLNKSNPLEKYLYPFEKYIIQFENRYFLSDKDLEMNNIMIQKLNKYIDILKEQINKKQEEFDNLTDEEKEDEQIINQYNIEYEENLIINIKKLISNLKYLNGIEEEIIEEVIEEEIEKIKEE